jgi:hypothetical protein
MTFFEFIHKSAWLFFFLSAYLISSPLLLILLLLLNYASEKAIATKFSINNWLLFIFMFKNINSVVGS